MRPWATMVAITVVYDDGHTRTVKAYPEEDALDDVCNGRSGDLHDVLDQAATAHHFSANKGESYHRGLGRGRNYPVAVVVAMVEGALFGGKAPDPNCKLDSDFERVDHEGRCSTFRVFDVAGFVFMENLERLLDRMVEWRMDDEDEAAA